MRCKGFRGFRVRREETCRCCFSRSPSVQGQLRVGALEVAAQQHLGIVGTVGGGEVEGCLAGLTGLVLALALERLAALDQALAGPGALARGWDGADDGVDDEEGVLVDQHRRGQRPGAAALLEALLLVEGELDRQVGGGEVAEQVAVEVAGESASREAIRSSAWTPCEVGFRKRRRISGFGEASGVRAPAKNACWADCCPVTQTPKWRAIFQSLRSRFLRRMPSSREVWRSPPPLRRSRRRGRGARRSSRRGRSGARRSCGRSCSGSGGRGGTCRRG